MKSFAAFATCVIVLLVLAISWNTSNRNAAEAPAPAPLLAPGQAHVVASTMMGPPPIIEEIPESTGALDFEVALSHEAIGEASFEELYAEVRVEATEQLPEIRPALNVALVIDRSGSMSGNPIEHVRGAARSFVASLQEGDRVALISFDHQARVELESTFADEQGKGQLLAAIDRIRPGGATNISEGLRLGFEQVRDVREPQSVDRVVMMTDGIPNSGISSVDGLAAAARSVRNEGITVSTLGFGTMYNAEMLALMATEGAGNHRYIRDVNDMELAFSQELEDLRNTVASGIQVFLKPAGNVRIVDIYGFNRERVDGGDRIVLGDLQAEGRRSIIARLSVPAGERRDAQALIEVRAQYVDRVAEGPAAARFELDVDRVDDESVINASVNSQVMARVEEVRSQNSFREVLNLYAAGQVQQAQKKLEGERRRSRAARVRYEIDAESEEADRVDSMMNRIGSAVRTLGPSTREGRDMVQDVSATSVRFSQGR